MSIVYFAVISEDGFPTAFYNTDVFPSDAHGQQNAAIPSAAIIITAAQWQTAINGNGHVKWDGKDFQPFAPPVVAQQAVSISRAQFYEALAVTPDPSKTDGSTMITPDEAVAAMSGAIPAKLAALVANLPASSQLGAKMKLAGATIYEIDNPLTLALAQAYGWSTDQLNALWNAASAL